MDVDHEIPATSEGCLRLGHYDAESVEQRVSSARLDSMISIHERLDHADVKPLVADEPLDLSRLEQADIGVDGSAGQDGLLSLRDPC